MSAAPAPVEVKVGQVWEAYSTRRRWTTVRTFHVLELVNSNSKEGTVPSARCHVVETGAKVVIEIQRMKPGKTRGYRLVSEAPAM